MTIREGTTIGYLQQGIWPSPERELLGDAANASTRIADLAHRIHAIQVESAGVRDNERSIELLHELGALQHSYQAVGGEWGVWLRLIRD